MKTIKLTLRPLKREYGYLTVRGDKISVDPMACIFCTVFHELLHDAFPDLKEREVRRLERLMIRQWGQNDNDSLWCLMEAILSTKTVGRGAGRSQPSRPTAERRACVQKR